MTLLQARVAGADAGGPQPGRRLLLLHGGDQRHHFRAAGDDQVLRAGADLRGRQGCRGNAAAAETVERHAADARIEARIECRHTPEVAALAALLRAHRPDDVVDVLRVDAVAVAQCAQNRCREVLGMHVGERALPRFADTARGADSVDDIGFGHRVLRPPVSRVRGARLLVVTA